MKQHHVKRTPYQHGVERPQVAVGRVREIGANSDERLYSVRRVAGESVHCAGLLKDTGVELIQWRSSAAAATPIASLSLKMQWKD
jgi:hypothetical protein